MELQEIINSIESAFNLASKHEGYVVTLYEPKNVEELENTTEEFVGVTFVTADSVELDDSGLVMSGMGGRTTVSDDVKNALFLKIRNEAGLEARLI